MTEDEMVGWHYQLNGHEFEQAPGVDDGQGSLACFSPWGHKESDVTEQLNELNSNRQRKACFTGKVSRNIKDFSSVQFSCSVMSNSL